MFCNFGVTPIIIYKMTAYLLSIGKKKYENPRWPPHGETQRGYQLFLFGFKSLWTQGTYIPKGMLVAEREVKSTLTVLITSTNKVTSLSATSSGCNKNKVTSLSATSIPFGTVSSPV